MSLRRLHGLFFLTILSALTAAASESASPFIAHTLRGETLTNDSLRGQVVLLQFWTTW